MSKKELNIILGILLFLVLLFIYIDSNTEKKYNILRDEVPLFEQKVHKIYELKQMEKNSRSILSQLTRIKQPNISKRGNILIYEFKNLNVDNLNSLVRKIKGSFLQIKKLKIEQDSTNHADLILEIYR